jgi:hypothetical protein
MDAAELRWCGGCGQLLDRAMFAFRSRARHLLQPCCRTCQSRRAREHYLQHSSEYKARALRNGTRTRIANRQRLYDYLASQHCADCGAAELAVLEFDHRDPATKRNEVGNLLRSGLSWRAIVNEIQKCDVVCANCHRRRTAQRFGWHKVRSSDGIPTLPELPKRGSPDYDRAKSRRSCLARRHRNRVLVLRYLAEHACLRCGERDPVVLEFDHVGEKRADIGWLINAVGTATILDEIRQCRVLCANCHRMHTSASTGRRR